MLGVTILNESGYKEALLGLSLSYQRPLDEMPKVVYRLLRHPNDSGHLKFLESIVVWLDIDAPRYWWQQFDTYRIGTTKQSESTMHTIMNRRLEQSDFVYDIPEPLLELLNKLIDEKDFGAVKLCLPEGFMQRRMVCLNYKVLCHMYNQRKNHRLPEWEDFFSQLQGGLEYPELVRFYGQEG